ncbi:hypothetical protein [Brachyspira suanatina]|uniref:hypothetical protein n=1 Tax=Brachyspira suanatina TaxID=381802 RepID=UPI001ADF1AFD|nr:hypothetical protein [Brachyspira suanatina]
MTEAIPIAIAESQNTTFIGFFILLGILFFIILPKLVPINTHIQSIIIHLGII